MDRWMTRAHEEMVRKGTVGEFGAAAKREHMGTRAFARHVLRKGSTASTKRKRQANFALTAIGRAVRRG